MLVNTQAEYDAIPKDCKEVITIESSEEIQDDFRILECEVPLDKIIMPTYCFGKVRTSELTVLREVPLEEWGVMGKIIGRIRQ